MSNKTDQIVADNLGKMTRAALLGMINNIQKQAKLIPPDQTEALKCMEMCLQVIEQYEVWVMGLKAEILKMNAIISAQNDTLSKTFQRNKIVLPGEV